MTDPTIGVWLSEDGEVAAPDPRNLYRLEGNNPINEVDPTGLAGERGERLPAYLYTQTFKGSWDPELFFYRMNGGRNFDKNSDEWQWFKKGCVGLCALRTGSYKAGKFPQLMKGARVFSTLADALKYQESLGYEEKAKHLNAAKPVLFALQSKNDFLKDAKRLEGERKGEIDPKSLRLTAYNFATAFQNQYGCIEFWEWMNESIDLNPDSTVRHGADLPSSYPYIVYIVVESESTYVPPTVPFRKNK